MKILKSIILALPVLALFSFSLGKEEILVVKTSVVCDMCKDRIERDLPFEKGIKEVEVDVKKNIITVHYNPEKTTPDKIRKAISLMGYRADDIPADPKGFAKLPKCCQAEGCGK